MIHSVKEAKDNLSSLIKMAELGEPQIILRHDKEVAVVISINDWKRLNDKRPNLVEVLRNCPLGGTELDFSRQPGSLRDVDFGEE